MEREQILAGLKEAILADLYLEDVQLEDLDENTVLFGDGLGLDSIDAVELVVIVEKHFKVAVKDAEEAKSAFLSLGALADYIIEKQKSS